MQWYMQKKHSNSLHLYSCLDQSYLSYLSNLIYEIYYVHIWSFPGGSNGKESAHNARDSGSIPAGGRSLEEGIQFSCLENAMDSGKAAR